VELFGGPAVGDSEVFVHGFRLPQILRTAWRELSRAAGIGPVLSFDLNGRWREYARST
jgi:hypothetical protein